MVIIIISNNKNDDTNDEKCKLDSIENMSNHIQFLLSSSVKSPGKSYSNHNFMQVLVFLNTIFMHPVTELFGLHHED